MAIKQISESFLLFSLYMQKNICQLYLYKLFAYSTFDGSLDHQLWSLYRLFDFNSQALIPALNIIQIYLTVYFFIDLVNTIRYPMSSSRNGIVETVMLAIGSIQILASCTLLLYDSDRFADIVTESAVAMFIICMLCSVFCIVLSFIQLQKMTFCRAETKRTFLRIIIVNICWVVCNLYYFYGFLVLLNPNNLFPEDGSPRTE